MDNESMQIEQLIIKKISGELNKSEQAILDQWLSQSPENRKELDSYKNLWERSENLVMSGSINVEGALKKTKRRIPAFGNKKRYIVYLRQAAAVLILSIFFSGLAYYFFINKENRIVEEAIYQEIRTAFGTQSQINLPDGTLVWLNSGSTLKYPGSFSDMDTRSVELNGEGYFQVTKNSRKPFIVKTTDINVKVLGTEFNVSAYDDYHSTTVALERGKVSLFKTVSGTDKNLLVLNPNEVAEYEKTEGELIHHKEISLEKYVAWKDGMIVFFNDPIQSVTHKLEKWYNVKIEIGDSEIETYSFTATFVNEPLEQVLRLLSVSSPISYKITPAQKLSDNSYSKRIITILKK
ncbi:DUF4974 domain-containing protein [Maribellus comscasis]|uniref:DUF4974 domain-containing protein n=1 Tax=Maribellus comscasis TaxID=2681766 RepID=A0A6I6JRI2_9BACT|nr:FecR domain-containing protein [Maribellus comscasis]QGY45021.1 DUF4974 domain-containing protein [Maribellus comscasis]